MDLPIDVAMLIHGVFFQYLTTSIFKYSTLERASYDTRSGSPKDNETPVNKSSSPKFSRLATQPSTKYVIFYTTYTLLVKP